MSTPIAHAKAAWIARCAERLLELDARVAAVDAADVASSMWEQDRWSRMAPRLAAEALFEASEQPVSRPAPLAR